MKRYFLLVIMLLSLLITRTTYSIDLSLYPAVDQVCTIKANTIDLFCSDNKYEEAAEKIQWIFGNWLRHQWSENFDKKMSILEQKVRTLHSQQWLSKSRKIYIEMVLLYVMQYKNNTVDVWPLLDNLFGNNQPQNQYRENNTPTLPQNQYRENSTPTLPQNQYVENNTPILPVFIKLIVEGIFPRWWYGKKAWFWVRFSSRDINENSRNPVIEWTVPQGYCLEFTSLPTDFLYLREWWWDRLSYHDWSMTHYYDPIGIHNFVYCGIGEFKILLPEKQNFFSKWFGIWFIDPLWEPTYPACTRLTFTADNAQYDESEFCVQYEVWTPAEGYKRVKFEEGINSGQIKVVKQ